MKTTVNRKSDTQVSIQTELGPEIVNEKLKKLLLEVSRTFEVPGFRKGHLPKGYLENRFGKDFLNEDAQNQLIEEYLPKAIVENKIEPASRPQHKVQEPLVAGKPFQFEVEVEVFPEVKLSEKLEIEVEAPAKRQINNLIVEEALENLKLDHATLIPRADGEVSQPNDVVAIRDGKGRTQEIQARPEGWMSVLIGVKTGDAVVLKPSADEEIDVRVDSVKRIELPDLDDLAKTLGNENADGLKAEVEKQLNERAEYDYQQALKLKVLDNLVDQISVVVPAGLVEELLQQDLQILRKNKHEATPDEIERLRKSIERRVQRDRVLRAVQSRENLGISDEEFEKFINAEAEKRNANPVKFKAVLQRDGQLERIRNEQETTRVLDHLVSIATINEPQEQSKSEQEKE